MLAQLVALLTLGVLCSSAPMPAPRPTNATGHLQQDQCSSTFVESIISEVLSDVKKGGVIVTVLSVVPENVTSEKCMHNNLKIFVESLKANEATNTKTITQLSTVYKCKKLFSKVPDKECKTVQVSGKLFMGRFETFLGFLYQEL